MDILQRINEALDSETPSQVEWRTQLENARFEIERLQAAKRRALEVADERGKEAVELRGEVERLRRENEVFRAADYEAIKSAR